MIFKGFVGPTYQSASLNADAQRAVNLIPEPVASEEGVKHVFYGAPGKHLFGTLPTTPVRGLWAGDNRLFAAGGSKLYEVSSGGSPTLLGDIGNDGYPVQMFPNGDELFVTSNGKGWIADGVGGTSDVTEVTDARTGAFLDGYFLANPPSSKKFFYNELGSGASWPALNFFSKEGYPDNIASLLADHRELWLFGNETTELWRNEGDGDFVFQQDPGGFNHMGTAAIYSPCRLPDARVAWLAGDARTKIFAVVAQGFMPKPVSTPAVEKKWESYSTVSDAESYSYKEGGHVYWVITFPTANATWCYDATTNLWHERAWWDGSALQRDRGHCHAYVFGKHLVGDWENGKIYHQSMDFCDDFGGDKKYQRTAPHIEHEKQRVRHPRLQVDLETGNGTLAATLRVSKDSGRSYGADKTKSAGTTGEFTKRVIWRRLGASRDRVYDYSMVTQLKVAIMGAYLKAEADNS